MSLDGAKLIVLNDNDDRPIDEEDVILARGKVFKFGYYMDCDVVLEHQNAIGVQCVINCDAFGRVTIENCCPEVPIILNGKAFKRMRPLLHNTKINILDKTFLWQFKGTRRRSLDMKSGDIETPCKNVVKAQQAPNSEPARRWRMEFQKRMTINNFAYHINANDNQQQIGTSNENKAPLIEIETVSPKKMKPTNLIDLKTPKIDESSLSKPRTPLSCCNLSETVITSYSPRETGVRSEKSFVKITPAKPTTLLSNISLGPFANSLSPHPLQHRPSMHLIDLTTPMRRVLPSTPNRIRDKIIPKPTTSTASNAPSIPTPPSQNTSVYSVESTDESIIEISDERSSPSPAVKTPSRPRTPQSLMKRAILSSAKKVAVAKRLQQSAHLPTKPSEKGSPAPVTSGVRFHICNTPQRKSLNKLQITNESPNQHNSLPNKVNSRFMATSTPFRSAVVTDSTPKRSIIRSPSTSFTSGSNKSRTSLMLKQALSVPKRKSVSFSQPSLDSSSSSNRVRKSEPFLNRIEKSQVNESEVLNETFSIEEAVHSDETESKTTTKKDATFSPNKDHPNDESSDVLPGLNENCDGNKEIDLLSKPTISPVCATPISEKPMKLLSTTSDTLSTDKSIDPDPDPVEQASLDEIPMSKDQIKLDSPHTTCDDCDDFDGLDEIFKTPKAKNLMVLSSPKSVALQKLTTPSVECINAADFNLTTNLEDIFKTPQSELITSQMDNNDTVSPKTTTVDNDNEKTLSPEEAFDKLIGRPTLRKSYTRKSTILRKPADLMDIPKDSSLPKTDIEEWIDSVSECAVIISDSQCENESVSYLPSDQNDLSKDPLTLSTTIQSSIPNDSNANKYPPIDEVAMNIDNVDDSIPKRNPLELTPTHSKRSISPNISGIDLLDRTPESIFSETLAVSDESSSKEHEKTICLPEATADGIVMNQSNCSISISPDKARIEMEKAFEHFELERKKITDGRRLASTPDPKKPLHKVMQRRTMGNQKTMDEFFNPKALEPEREKNATCQETGMGFEATPQLVKPTSQSIKSSRNTDSDLDLKAAKQQREMELAFENFDEEPEYREERVAKTPEPKQKSLKDKRRTMGSNLRSEVSLDLKAAKQQKEMELAFENFGEEPEYREERAARTPQLKQKSLKDKRRTMGSNLGSEVNLDLKAAKQQREMELAFENFDEEPEYREERAARTPEPKQKSLKDNRRTMGSNLGSEVNLDLKAAKQQREIELAFENFEQEPEHREERVAKTPEPKQKSLKDNRRTMGSNLGSEVNLDLKAAKQQRELQLAFENFDEEPEYREERAAKTPKHKQKSLKDNRRTMGSNLGSEVNLDLKAAKQQRELELAFENFEEEPEHREERVAKTPEPKQKSLKDKRRTMGSNLGSEVNLDLKAAKQQREIELAFENFEEEPEHREERVAKTPEPKQKSLKDKRRTMGSNLGSEVNLDLKAAKQQRELQLAFENFDEEPEYREERAAKTPEHKQKSLKDNRRTMGSNLGSEVNLDLKAAKQQRELELAFENFEEEPEHREERVAKTPEPKQKSLKDKRRTMGSNLGSEVNLDLKAAKQQREIELAFENFEEEPEHREERVAKTPEPKQKSLKDNRRTMGSNLGSEVNLDLKAAKQQRELELAFENFEQEPEHREERVAKTPEPKQKSLKDNRRTMGSNLGSEVNLDLKAAKQQRELQLAFENFDEEPEYREERAAKTPEHKQKSLKDNRRTMGSNLGSEVNLDLKAAKQQRELELAFENFEEEPEHREERVAKTPEPKQKSLKDKRRTMGSNLGSEVNLDLKAAKQQREIELAFENFEEEPEHREERVAKTPEPKQKSLKDNRRTMGSNLGSEVNLDLKAAKQQREIELAFENFEEEPEHREERVAKTPEPKQKSLKDKRRTMGSNLGSEVNLDLKAAKQQRELELAFENFEQEPEHREERVAKTPEPKQKSLKDKRRTMGSNLGSEVNLDLKAAKQQREIELAFENFEEEPEHREERVAKTPEPKQKSLKDNRRTMGSNLGSEVNLDLKAAKQQRELQLAFENFDEGPEYREERAAKTPEHKQKSLKDNRRTMGSNLESEVNIDLKKIKDEREMKHLSVGNEESEPAINVIPIQTKTRKRKAVILKNKPLENAKGSSNEQIVSPISAGVRSTRRRRNIVDEDKQTSDDQNVNKSNLKSQERPGPRTRRQNSVDLSSNIQTLPNYSYTEQTPDSINQESSSHAQEQSKLSERMDEDEQRINSQMDSNKTDSLGDDIKQTPIAQSRRLRTRLLSTETALESASKSLHLDPIAEEERQISSAELNDPKIDENVRSTRRRAAQRTVAKATEGETKSETVLNLKAEVDEIVSSSPVPSKNRVRGRKAQLSVILLNSKTPESVPYIKVEPVDEFSGDDDAGPVSTNIDTSAEIDVIPSTPAPTTRRRRGAPVIKKEFAINKKEETSRVGKRGRKAHSPVPDNLPHRDDMKEDTLVSSTPVSSGLQDPSALQKTESATPNRRGARTKATVGAIIEKEIHHKQIEKSSANTEQVVEFIPSTPVPSTSSRTTRKLAVKSRGKEPAIENSSPKSILPESGQVSAQCAPTDYLADMTPNKRTRRRANTVDTGENNILLSEMNECRPSDDKDPIGVESAFTDGGDQPVVKSTRTRRGKNDKQTIKQVEPVELIESAVEDETKANSNENKAKELMCAPETESSGITTRRNRRTPQTTESTIPVKTRLRRRATVDDRDITSGIECTDTEEMQLTSKAKRGPKHKINTEPAETTSEILSPMHKKTRNDIQEELPQTSVSSALKASSESSDLEQSFRNRALKSNVITQNATPIQKKRGRKPKVPKLDQQGENTSHGESSNEPESHAKPTTTRSNRRRKDSANEEKSESSLEKDDERKPLRSRRRNHISPIPLQTTSEPESEETTQKKTTRNRKAPLKEDNVSESISYTDEENSLTVTKTKRPNNQKDVASNPTPEKGEAVLIEENQTHALRSRRANGHHESSGAIIPDDDENKENPITNQNVKKKTRGRKPAQKKSETLIATATDDLPVSSPSAQKVNSHDDQLHQSESQRKTTRSRKDLAEPIKTKNDEKPAPKRAYRRNIDITAPADHDTPPKRQRRKPNILLNDEFVS